MKKLLAILFALLICLTAVSCGSSVYEKTIEEPFASSYSLDMAMDNGFSYAAKAGGYAEESARGSVVNDAEQSEKMVYYSNVSMETSDFESASETLHALIEKHGGIIEYENVYDLDSDYTRMNMTVRIPQENYNAFLEGLSADYHVVSVSNRVENMTEAYYDNENRLKAYRVQEERLFDLLAKAENVQDMLDIEDRLRDVQYMIESYTNAQRKIDNDVRYATFTLTLSEVVKFTEPAPRTFVERLVDTVRDSLERFRDFAEGSLFVFIYLTPYALIGGVIALVIVLPIRAASRRRRKKAQAQENAEPKK